MEYQKTEAKNTVYKKEVLITKKSALAEFFIPKLQGMDLGVFEKNLFYKGVSLLPYYDAPFDK